MPWCPKCKNEYVEGIKICADCGCSLVDSLDDIGEALTFGTEEEMRELADFLTYNKIVSANLKPAGEDGIFEIYVSDADRKKAGRLASVFLQQIEAKKKEKEAQNAPEESGGVCCGTNKSETVPEKESDEKESAGNAETQGVYEEASKKAAEYKSGAQTLIAVGILGFILLGLLIGGVLPVRLSPASQTLTVVVMGTLFLIFIVMGVLSVQSYRKLSKKAESENSLKEELMKYCAEKLQAAKLDEEAEISGTDTQEVRYFKRTERLKERIREQYPEVEENYLDNFADEIYPQIFEK